MELRNGEDKGFDRVSKYLAKEMDKALARGMREEWSQELYKEALMKIIHKERQALKSGRRMLNSRATDQAVDIILTELS